MLKCRNCGKEFKMTDENGRSCKPCRNNYGLLLRSIYPNAGRFYRRTGRDLYSEKLRHGFEMMEGTYRG